MSSFIFAVNAVLPILIMVAVGYILKRVGMIKSDMAKGLNKLVFRLFLPVMLFLNVYNISDIGSIEFDYVLYALIAVFVVFVLALLAVPRVTASPASRGALLQSTFRSNFALIGIPLATSLFGAQGAAVAAVLSAFSIPAFNALAVISLSVYSGKEGRGLRSILIGIVKNPLIQAVVAGILALLLRSLFTSFDVTFRLTDLKPLFTVLDYLSGVATPLALIVLGAQFEFSAVAGMRREIIFGVAVRTVLVPLFCIGIACLAFRDQFGGAEFAAFIALFSTPVAVSSVPMAQEMDADYVLAGQLVVWSTLVSAFTVFITVFILSLVGVFPAM